MIVAVRGLEPGDVELVRAIDRSEHVDRQYAVIDGRLVDAPVFKSDIPAWDPHGDGEFSVAHQIHFCAERVAEGGVLLGAFDHDSPLGIAIVHPRFEPPMAWLSWLHVSRPHRRRGAAAALWNEAARQARNASAITMYVSATPTGSAVGFYLSRGCHLATPPHPALFAKEPEDIHLVCDVGPGDRSTTRGRENGLV